MSTGLQASLGEGLHVRLTAPVRFSPLENPPGANLLARIDDETLQAFQMASIVEEQHDSFDESHILSVDILRIEMKMNLIMGLMGKLLEQHLDLSEPSDAVLFSDRLIWSCPDQVIEGKIGLCSLHLHSQIPFSATFYGEIVRSWHENGDHWAEISFEHRPTALADAVEKYIFRHHRRSVAEARQA